MAYVEPIIEGKSYRFTVKVGKPQDAEGAKRGTTAGKRAAFNCLMSGVPITYDYIRDEGKSGRMGTKLMVIVAEGTRGRVYLSPISEHEELTKGIQTTWKPENPLHGKCRVNVSNYGMDTFGDLFTPRQLVALTTFSDLVTDARDLIKTHAINAGMPDDGKGLNQGGLGATAYADAVGDKT